MATIKYTATFNDAVGRSKEVNLTVAISEKERCTLEDAMAGESDGVQPVLERVLREVQASVFADGPWICFYRRPGKFTHHSPAFLGRPPTGDDFNVRHALHCGNRVSRHLAGTFGKLLSKGDGNKRGYSSGRVFLCQMPTVYEDEERERYVRLLAV
jgi:hypothetical protein